MVRTRAQYRKEQLTVTNTDGEDDSNKQALRELEEKITKMKEEAQRNRATKDNDDTTIKNLNDVDSQTSS